MGATTWTCRTCDQTAFGPPLNSHCTALTGPAAGRLRPQECSTRTPLAEPDKTASGTVAAPPQNVAASDRSKTDPGLWLKSGSVRNMRVPSSVAAGVKWSQSGIVPIQHRLWEVIVSGTVARVTEISARSDTSFEEAVNLGLDRANATLRSVKSAWIKEQSVDVENGAVVAYRVNLLVTFVLE